MKFWGKVFITFKNNKKGQHFDLRDKICLKIAYSPLVWLYGLIFVNLSEAYYFVKEVLCWILNLLKTIFELFEAIFFFFFFAVSLSIAWVHLFLICLGVILVIRKKS